MKRKYLRKQVQQVLKSAKISGVGSSVYCRKSTRHDDGELPIVVIYPNNEASQRFDQAPKRYKKFFEVIVEITADADSDDELCDILDDLAYEVEQAIESDATLQGLEGESIDTIGSCVEDTEQSSVSYDMQADGSSPIGAVKIIYTIEYIDEPFKKIIRTPFNGVDIEYKIGDHGDNKAIDQVDLPQQE